MAELAEAGTGDVFFQEILGSAAGQGVLEGSEDYQQLVLPPLTERETDNEASQVDEDISKDKNAQAASIVIASAEVPAVTPTTSAPTDYRANFNEYCCSWK